MKIIVELDGDNAGHLLALTALINALGFELGTLASDGHPTPPVPSPVAAPLSDAPAPPPPAAIAPPPPPVSNIAAPAPPAAATGDVDSSGLPWDARIHAGEKQTTADGKWRKRRGAPADLVAAVEAELRGATGAAVPPPPAHVATASAEPVATAVADAPPPPPAAAPPPPAAVAPGPKTSDNGLTFQQVLSIGGAKGLAYDVLNSEVAPMFGVDRVSALIGKPEVWDELAAVLSGYPDFAAAVTA